MLQSYVQKHTQKQYLIQEVVHLIVNNTKFTIDFAWKISKKDYFRMCFLFFFFWQKITLESKKVKKNLVEKHRIYKPWKVIQQLPSSIL